MAGDAFEESEMHDGAPIVRRDKLVSRGMTALFFGSGLFPMAIAILIAMTNSTSAKPLPPTAMPFVVAALAAFGMAMWLGGIVFGVLRTVVTKKAVHIKYGLWGPTIPLDAIESARVIDYDWTEFGGWGMRIGKGGARAFVPRNGPCVELVYRDGEAKKRVLVGAENAAATVTSIREAQTHVRVAAPESALENEEAISDSEAEADDRRRAERA